MEAALRSLAQSVAALEVELANGDPDSWPSLAAEIEDASRSLREKWRHLDASSPFRTAADNASELLAKAVACFPDGPLPPGLARELVDWTRIRGRREVAVALRAARSRLGDISLREAARRSAIAPGHLSELEDGTRSLPTTSTAQRLDDALGTDLVRILARVHDTAKSIQSRRRRPTVARPSDPWLSAAIDPRLDTVIARIAGDDKLLQLNEDVLRLPAGARRAIAQMVRALVADVGPNRP